MGAARGRTCLITGCGGFVGSHLAGLMHNRQWRVYGTVHRSTERVKDFEGNVRLSRVDVADAAQVHRLIAEAQPDVVFHLAGQSHLGRSWEDPVGTFRTNTLGTLHLLEAVGALRREAAIIVVGSSAEYGQAGRGGEPIGEETPFQPGSPYAVSKIALDMLAYTYWRRYGLRTVRVRPFALIGPGKDDDAVAEFARAIVRVERREAESVAVGNLDAVRDFLDVRDGATALACLAERGAAGCVYNLCSGTGRTLQEVLDGLLALAQRPVSVVRDPARLRASDDPVLIGDSRRLRACGWEPTMPLQQTLRDVMAFWRGVRSLEAAESGLLVSERR